MIGIPYSNHRVFSLLTLLEKLAGEFVSVNSPLNAPFDCGFDRIIILTRALN